MMPYAAQVRPRSPRELEINDTDRVMETRTNRTLLECAVRGSASLACVPSPSVGRSDHLAASPRENSAATWLPRATTTTGMTQHQPELSADVTLRGHCRGASCLRSRVTPSGVVVLDVVGSVRPKISGGCRPNFRTSATARGATRRGDVSLLPAPS